MGLELSSAEQAVLTALGEAHPQKVHLHELAAKIVPPLEHSELLKAVDGLYSGLQSTLPRGRSPQCEICLLKSFFTGYY
jgi:hypothetical protein